MLTGIYHGSLQGLFLKCTTEKNGGGVLFGGIVNYISKTAGEPLGVFIIVCVICLAVIIFLRVDIVYYLKKVFVPEHIILRKGLKEKKEKKEYPVINEPVTIRAASRKNTETKQKEIKKKSVGNPSYNAPGLSLLKEDKECDAVNVKEHEENGNNIIYMLANFGIKAEYISFVQGSSVTRYEIRPDARVRLDKITSLSHNLMAVLKSGNIRIIAPIPGKDTVGIEVPNKERRTVYLKKLLESKAFYDGSREIPIVIGDDIEGKPVIDDLAEMPHLLIAGTTGAGKSACLNSILLSILYRFSPEEVRFIITDPKQVEFVPYIDLPHLLFPVITDMGDTGHINAILNWIINEMERRYTILAQTSTDDLKSYNRMAESKKEGKVKLPRIVIVIDEFADLMMNKNVNVTECVMRLGQKARAAGIHLILATQRPSAKAIPGEIKANMPGRIALTTASAIDSRIDIECNGAEKLLKKGDMLYTNGGSEIKRVQGTFTDKTEVFAVTEFIRHNNPQVIYEELSVKENEREYISTGAHHRDALFAEIEQYVRGLDEISIGRLQRRFSLGFNRAARIMDQLEKEGIVGSENGKNPRAVIKALN